MDKRRVARYKFTLGPMQIKDRPSRQANLLDISPLGVQIETDFPMREHDFLEFSTQMPEGEIATLFTGKVVWVKQVSQQPDLYRIGLAFVDLPAPAQQNSELAATE